MALLTVTEAENLVLQHASPAGTESIDLGQAIGRFLAETIRADRDYPPINRATMDGIAMNPGNRPSWIIERTIAAGEAAPPLADPGRACARIMTGAELPSNTSTVIPVEDIMIDGSSARLREGASYTAGQHVHRKGLDRRQGDVVLSPGIRLDAPRIAILAGCGYARVSVAKKMRVSILSTGNEIVPVSTERVAPHQSRMSNLEGIRAGLLQLGLHDVHPVHVADNEQDIREAIAGAVSSSGVLIITGGMSKGQYDYAPAALEACGVEKIFHGVAQKPGKPFWFGQSSSCVVFGLPGNPVSTLTVFRRYLVPFFHKKAGAVCRHAAIMSASAGLPRHASLTLFTPVKAAPDKDGTLIAEAVEYHGSGDLTALAESDGFVEVAPGASTASKDQRFPFYSWS